jgi:hypothetical protein
VTGSRLALSLSVLGAAAMVAFIAGNVVFGIVAEGTWVFLPIALLAPDLYFSFIASFFLFICRLLIFFGLVMLFFDKIGPGTKRH